MKLHRPSVVFSALVAVIASGACVSALAAADAVVLAKKDHMPAPGTTIATDSSMTMNNCTMKISAGGQDMEGTLSQSETRSEQREYLGPDKYKFLLAKRAASGKMKMGDEEQVQPDRGNPLVGVPVMMERKDGKWTATLEDGKPLSDEQQAQMQREISSLAADNDWIMYGDTPRQPGDEWDVDPSKLTNFGGGEKLTGKFHVKFVETKDVNGVPCAVLAMNFEIKGKTEAADAEPSMNMQLKGEAHVVRAIKDLVDLDATVKGTVTMNGSPGPDVSVKATGPIEMTERKSVKKP